MSVRLWGSGTGLEGTGLVLDVLFWDWDAELDASTKCGSKFHSAVFVPLA